jgi:hypothetical protein
VQWVKGGWGETDHPYPFNAKVKNSRATHPLSHTFFMVLCFIKSRDNFTFTSPDLTTLQFYLWGFPKDVVYHRKSLILETLGEEIEMLYATILVDTLTTVAHVLVC